jgi:hypothetical protein
MDPYLTPLPFVQTEEDAENNFSCNIPGHHLENVQKRASQFISGETEAVSCDDTARRPREMLVR